MTEDLSKQIAYGLDNLPNAPPLGDLTRLYSPAELAAIRMRRAAPRGRNVDRLDDIPASAIASVAGGFVPGSGIADFLGYYPNFEGGHEPSFVENMRLGNYGSAGLQTLGLAGDALYVVPVLGATVGTAVKAPRAIQRVGRWAKYAEWYPDVGPPALYDRATGKQILFNSQAEAEALVAQRIARWGKKLTPEAKRFARDRRAMQRDMDTYGYTPHFDPAKRADIDPRDYPTEVDTSVDAMPAKPETRIALPDTEISHRWIR